jgi:hypothetical protein
MLRVTMMELKVVALIVIRGLQYPVTQDTYAYASSKSAKV